MSITTPAATTVTNGSAAVTLSVTGSPSRVSLRVDNVEVSVVTSPYSTTLNTSSLSEGTHALTARAELGSDIVDSAAVSIVVDRTAPTISSRSPEAASSPWWLEPLLVTFSEDIDAASLQANAFSVMLSSSVAAATTTSPVMQGRSISSSITTQLDVLPVTVSVTLSGIRDLAGNTMSPATWSYVVSRWSTTASVTPSANHAALAPAIAVNAQGATYVAFSELTFTGNVPDAAATIQVRKISFGKTEAVGAGLAIATSPTVAPHLSLVIDAQNRPVLAYADLDSNQVFQVVVQRFENNAWARLGSGPVSAGMSPELAIDGAGGLVVGFVTEVSSLPALSLKFWAENTATWSSGTVTPFTPTGFVFTPNDRFSLLSSSNLAVAVTVPVLGKNQVRVYSPLQGWSQLDADLNVYATHDARSPVLAKSSTEQLYVAWEEHDGTSTDIHVSKRGGTGWEHVGHPLDVDLRQHATRPQMVMDSTDHPIVAWLENGDFGSHNLRVSRFDGTEWRALGGERPASQPALGFLSEPVMTQVFGVPIIAFASHTPATTMANTDVSVLRFNATGVPLPFGLAARAAPSSCSVFVNDVPVTVLSQTNCFTSLSSQPTPQADLIPFDLNSPLWSDGALKRRWLRLPDAGVTVTFADAGAFLFPIGTMLVKEFSYLSDPTDVGTRHAVETRFLVKREDAGWEGFSYQWNDTFTEATYLNGVAATKFWPQVGPPDAGYVQIYPSSAQCDRCHSASAGKILGLRAGQLNRDYDYNGVVDNELRALTHAGVFGNSGPTFVTAQALPRFTPPVETTEPLVSRVRGYLSANCSHCHNPAGERPTRDFRWDTAMADTNICSPTSPEVIPQNVSGSLMHQRISKRGSGQMPPIATSVVDDQAVLLVDEWISSITVCQ